MSNRRGELEPASDADCRIRVLWITNHAAPYRRPVWRALGEECDVDVLLLEDGIGSDGRANRGIDWNREQASQSSIDGRAQGYSLRVIRTLRARLGEARYYVLLAVPKLRNIDVVLLGGWESPAYWQAACLAGVMGLRRVGFYESHARSSAYSKGLIAVVRRRWFRMLDAVVVPGEASARAVRAMGVQPSRIFVGFNAVDVEAISAEAVAHRRSGEGHRFVYIGQLIARKNVATLVQAFCDVRASGDVLTLIGVGEQERQLRSLVTELGLEDAVRFAGYVQQSALGSALGRADTLVLPSRYEVWGLVVNEALAAGLQVVVSSAAGVAESVKQMPGVWLVEPRRDDVARGLREARQAYRGPISHPPIVQFTPERFAAVFASAFRFSMESRRQGSRKRQS